MGGGAYLTLIIDSSFIPISMMTCNLDSRLLEKRGLLYFNIYFKCTIISILSFPTSQKDDALLHSYFRLTQNVIVLQSKMMHYNL